MLLDKVRMHSMPCKAPVAVQIWQSPPDPLSDAVPGLCFGNKVHAGVMTSVLWFPVLNMGPAYH